MTAVRGWRCWDLDAAGYLWSPLNYGGDVKWEPGPMRAVCETEDGPQDHPVPAWWCSCGWRVVPGLEEFIHSACTDDQGRPIPLGRLDQMPAFLRPQCFVPKVVGLAVLGGRTCGADDFGDPETARRGEYAMVGAAVFLGRPFASAAAAVARRYGCDVIVADMPQGQWMQRAFEHGAGLAADVKQYEADPAALGRRLHRPAREARRRATARLREMPR